MLTAVLCLVSIIGHPSSLECGTDATTRLIPGRQMVMSGDVTPPAQGVTPVVVQLKMVGKLLTAIAEVPNGNFFALRVMGGGTVAGTSNSTFVVPTKNCTAQVYSNDMVPYGNPTTTYVSFFLIFFFSTMYNLPLAFSLISATIPLLAFRVPIYCVIMLHVKLRGTNGEDQPLSRGFVLLGVHSCWSSSLRTPQSNARA